MTTSGTMPEHARGPHGAGSSAGGIAVVGAGRMGQGIALAFAAAGHPVSLIDSELRAADAYPALAAAVAAEFDEQIDVLVEAGLVTAAQSAGIARNIELLDRTAGAARLARTAFVFEAVAEIEAVKHAVYAWLNACMDAQAIVASTSSTMSPDTLAPALHRPERFLNAHWLNPAHLMPLVEVSRGARTSAAALAALRTLLEAIGKVVVVCKASPGYIVARIQAAALNEAARLAEEGVAAPAEIDLAIRTGFGVRYAALGMLEFIDWGGGDILYYATEHLAKTVDAARFTTPQVVREHMAAGQNGLRDGRGFYDYTGVDVRRYRRERLLRLVGVLRHAGLLPRAAGGA